MFWFGVIYFCVLSFIFYLIFCVCSLLSSFISSLFYTLPSTFNLLCLFSIFCLQSSFYDCISFFNILFFIFFMTIYCNCIPLLLSTSTRALAIVCTAGMARKSQAHRTTVQFRDLAGKLHDRRSGRAGPRGSGRLLNNNKNQFRYGLAGVLI